jgi:hypothetical protein
VAVRDVVQEVTDLVRAAGSVPSVIAQEPNKLAQQVTPGGEGSFAVAIDVAREQVTVHEPRQRRGGQRAIRRGGRTGLGGASRPDRNRETMLTFWHFALREAGGGTKAEAKQESILSTNRHNPCSEEYPVGDSNP